MRDGVARGVALGALALVVLDALAVRAGVGAGALPTLASAAAWVTSRAAGVTAFLALSLSVAAGLLLSTGVADRWLPRARSLELHRWLSAIALGTTALHAVALLVDRHVRFDALDVLVPLLAPYRPIAVALGVAAAYLALVVHLSFGWRKRLGARRWRSLHYASFAAYAAAAGRSEATIRRWRTEERRGHPPRIARLRAALATLPKEAITRKLDAQLEKEYGKTEANQFLHLVDDPLHRAFDAAAHRAERGGRAEQPSGDAQDGREPGDARHGPGAVAADGDGVRRDLRERWQARPRHRRRPRRPRARARRPHRRHRRQLSHAHGRGAKPAPSRPTRPGRVGR